MPASDADAKIRWEEGEVPVSSRFNDLYFSREDGLAETRHVFLDGNRLEERFTGAEGFAIAELGFGTGLNCLAAAALWAERAVPGAVLSYTAFELYPLAADDIARALAPWHEVKLLAGELVAGWPAEQIVLPGVDLRIVRGDARGTVPCWDGRADAWFLDGFAPARNPEMWEPALLRAVCGRTAPGGTFATYAAAGRVRRALQAAGFEVARLPGFGRKREMLAGRRD